MTDPSAGFDGPTSHYFPSQRLNLHYLDWGNAGAPLVVLVHGGRDHAHSWDWVARELRGDYHVIAPDLRGHGDSDWSPDGAYVAPYLIVDLAELIAQLEAETVSIVAHSLGGAVALRYATLFPAKVRRIAAIEGIGFSDRAVEPVADRLLGFVEGRRKAVRAVPRSYATLAEAEARMQAANKQLSAEQIAHLTEHGVRTTEDGRLVWKFDRLTQPAYPIDLPDEDLRALWRRIDCPAWLVHGADSWASHPDAHGRSGEFRDVRVTSYERAGHWVQHDRFEDFTRDLKAFLA